MTKQAKRKCWILAVDVLSVPAMFLCQRLSEFLLTSTSNECQWMRLGGKCVTCGGTHFVNTFLSGQFREAFGHNQFLFVIAIFLILSFILLNFHWLFHWSFAEKILSRVYTIPTLIVFVCFLFAFFFWRNIPVFLRTWELLKMIL